MLKHMKKCFGRTHEKRATFNGKNTPLHSLIECFEGDASFVDILLQLDDSGINARNPNGETPLLMAVQNERCSPELIALLLEHGARLRVTSPRDGNTALHWLAIGCTRATGTRHCREICEILLRHGSDVNAKNLEGFTALHYAALSKASCQSLTGVLLRNEDVDAGSRNSKGDTAFHAYLRSQSRFCYARWFLEKMPDVNVVNNEGETLLHVAVRNRSCSSLVIAFLLNRGADVDSRDVLGENVSQAYGRAVEEDKRTADPKLLMLLEGCDGDVNSLRVDDPFCGVDSVHRLLRLETSGCRLMKNEELVEAFDTEKKCYGFAEEIESW